MFIKYTTTFHSKCLHTHTHTQIAIKAWPYAISVLWSTHLFAWIPITYCANTAFVWNAFWHFITPFHYIINVSLWYGWTYICLVISLHNLPLFAVILAFRRSTTSLLKSLHCCSKESSMVSAASQYGVCNIGNHVNIIKYRTEFRMASVQ